MSLIHVMIKNQKKKCGGGDLEKLSIVETGISSWVHIYVIFAITKTVQPFKTRTDALSLLSHTQWTDCFQKSTNVTYTPIPNVSLSYLLW